MAITVVLIRDQTRIQYLAVVFIFVKIHYRQKISTDEALYEVKWVFSIELFDMLMCHASQPDMFLPTGSALLYFLSGTPIPTHC